MSPRFLLAPLRVRPWIAVLAFPLLLHAADPAPQPVDPPFEDEQAQPRAEPPVETQESGLEERVVVTAGRIEQPAERVGSTISVISREEIERRQYRYVVDALRDVPGVDVRTSGGPGANVSLFLRGVDSDQTLVLLDGVPLNDPASPSRLPILAQLTTDGVERIEVLRGPQSTLYGADAIGGVIQIFTRRGSGPPTTRLGAEGGSYASRRAWLDSAGGSARLRYSVAASAARLDGFSATSAGVEDDGYDNVTGSGRIGWAPTPSFGLDAVLRVTDDRVQFDGFAEEENQYTDGRQEVLSLEPHLELLDGRWRQRIGVKVARHDRDTTATFPSRVRGELRTLSWQNDVTIGRVQTLVLGLEGEGERARFDTFDADATNVAAYAQDSLRLGPHGFATVGLRVDRHSEFGTEPTYRLTGGYALRSGTTLRASVGTGFKAPALFELHPSAFGGNPELEPERSRGYDLGVDQGLLDGAVLLGATLFENRIENLIVPVFDPGSLTFLNLNVDRARATGIETYARARPLDHLDLLASYTLTDTEALGTPATFGLEEGSPLLRRPRHKASLELSESLARGRLELVLSGLYVGARSDLDPLTFVATTAEAYQLYRLALSWDAAPRVRLSARVENLLDEEYEDTLGFGTAGRSGYVGLALTLGGGS